MAYITNCNAWFAEEFHSPNESGQARKSHGKSLSPLGMKADMTTFIDSR